MTDVSVISIHKPAELRSIQRAQKQTVQTATADLLATVALLEKALDGTLDNDAHALINAAYFQVNQVRDTFDTLVAQIDNIKLESSNE